MALIMNLLQLEPRGKLARSTSLQVLLLLIITLCPRLDAFSIPLSHTCAITATVTHRSSIRCVPDFLTQKRSSIDQHLCVVHAEKVGSSDNSPKKKRRRKQQPNASLDVSSAQVQNKIIVVEDLNDTSTMKDNDLTMMNEIARYEFQNKMDAPKVSTLPSIMTDDIANRLEPQQSTSSSSTVSGAIPLPDIKEARKRKQMEEENARIQKEQHEQKVKIKRTDKEAFRRVSILFHSNYTNAFATSTLVMLTLTSFLRI